MTETLGDTHHPAPGRHSVPRWMTLLALFGGPAAWFAQFNIGYALTSQPCFEGGMLSRGAIPGFWWLSVAAYVVCLVLALAAGLVATAMVRRVDDEVGSDDKHLLEIGGGRTHFLAKSGQFLGFGFALAIFVNILGLLLVPTCAG